MILLLALTSLMARAADYYPLQCRFQNPALGGTLRMDGVGKFELELNSPGHVSRCSLTPRARRELQHSVRPQKSILFSKHLACRPALSPEQTAKISKRVELVFKGKDLEIFILDQARSLPCPAVRFEKSEVERAVARLKLPRN